MNNPPPNPHLQPFWRTRPSRDALLLATLVVFLTAIRLWMTSIQRLWVMNGPHDDLLFLNAAETIKHFKWLGPYNETTLIKGPGYPLFVCFVDIIHLPLLLAQQLYYALTCIVLLIAVRPRLRSPWLLAMIYTFLLFNPVMTSVGNWMVLREGIYSGQSILVAATLIGLLVRLDWPRRSRLIWAVAAGYALSAVEITREEGIWLAPAAVILLAWIAFKLWQQRKALLKWEWLWLPALPGLLTVATMLLISTINYFVYNAFCVVEVKEPNFVAAIAAMQRVEPPHFHRLVPVTKETRQELYAVSPAFARLKPFFEGPQGDNWAKFGDNYNELHGSGEIGGAWFIWAVRQAVADLGLYKSSATARAYYRQLADEINAAVADGKLKGYPLHNTLAPPWRPEYARLMLDHSHMLLTELFGLHQDAPKPLTYESRGSNGVIKHFENATHDRALPNTPEAAARIKAAQDADPRSKTLVALQKAYGVILFPLGCIALAAIAAMLIVPPLRRRSTWALVSLFALAVSTVARCVLLLYIDVSSFYAAADSRYLGPAETYLMLMEIFAITAAVAAAVQWLQADHSSASSAGSSASLPTAIDAASTPAS
ncbi:MAG: hypothetical protein ACTHN5_17385 [Phycisphaerae bacterium]